MISFLSLFCHVYVLASLLQPNDTLDITLHFTRQLQDEVELHNNKIAAATRAADNDHNTIRGSFRFIRHEVRATMQTVINVAALILRVFILLSISLITALMNGFEFYRHVMGTTFRSSGKRKKINYRTKYNGKDTSLLTLMVSATTLMNDGTENNRLESTPPASEDLPWFKVLFPSNATTDQPSSETESKEIDKNEWNEDDTKESSLHTTTLIIGKSDMDTSDLSRSPSTSSVSSKASLATIATTSRRFFSLRRSKTQTSLTKKKTLSPPRPLAAYSSRPFTTSNALITASQIPHPLGSTLSLRLKQPARRLSRLFKTKK